MQNTTLPAPTKHIATSVETVTLPSLNSPTLAHNGGPRVRLFNVKYSPNLGDGLLSECLEQALVDEGAHPDTWSIDLAGRAGFGSSASGRSLQMRVLDAIPGALRHVAIRAPLAIQAQRRWKPHYRSSLVGADCVVIGGGNLLADLDLNFPTKLSLAIEEAARSDLPVFIYGCGVSAGWSRRGLTLLQRAIDHGVVRKVFVRDERSRQVWNELIGSAQRLEADVVRDPGLLAVERYRVGLQAISTRRPVIGLNITSQVALRYHAGNMPSASELDAWYLAVASHLMAAGFDMTVFTNGSPEDRACASRLRPLFDPLSRTASVTFAEVDRPGDLVHLIAGLTGIIAFRMHAVIAAYSCRIPFLALQWDPKLDAFVQSVDRGHWLCHPLTTSPVKAAEHMVSAIAEGISSAERDEVVAQSRQGVAKLHGEIARHLA